jgi:hypothetical protein
MIKKKILIVLLFILLLGIILKTDFHNFTDNFDNSNNILSNNNYLTFFSNNDINLRGFKNLNETKNYYHNSIIPFSKNEININNKIIMKFKKLLGKNFRIIFKDINFIRVKNNIENGMPHTRDRYIIFSKNYFESLYSKFNNNEEFLKSNREIVKLIAHEQFHIFQRYNLDKIHLFYTKYWNLVKYPKKLPNKILAINRTNPDALPSLNYLIPINDYYILPLCIYNDSAKTISDCKLVYLELNENMEFLDVNNYKNLTELKEYSNYFGNQGRNNYHPNELSASIFEDIVVNTIFNKNISNKSQGYKKMFLFLKDYDLF